MKKIILALALLLCASTLDAQVFRFSQPKTLFSIGSYKITGTKVFGWGAVSIGGAFDGMLEGYLFDRRTSFERKWGADPYGYWGRYSWKNVYAGGDPANGFKSDFHRIAGAWDFYHHADDLRKIGYVGGSIYVGIGGAKVNTKAWHYLADFAVGFAVSAATKSAGLYYIRN